jgi:hypothetical protein
MKLWKDGDRCPAACERCGKVVTATFCRRVFHLSEPEPIDVPDVLVAVCPTCDEIVAVPPQSSPRLRAERRRAGRVEARIPAYLADAIGLIAEKHGVQSDGLDGVIVRLYLRRIAHDPKLAGRIHAMLGGRLAQGKADGRVTIKVGGRQSRTPGRSPGRRASPTNPTWSAAS